MSVPNQKNITVQKSEKYSQLVQGDHLAIRSQSAEQLAATTLRPNAFKVWLYMTSNVNGYNFDLYSVDVKNKYGVSARSFTDAMKELELEGYLVPKEEGGKKDYYFYDIPQKVEEPYHIERRPAQSIQSQSFEF